MVFALYWLSHFPGNCLRKRQLDKKHVMSDFNCLSVQTFVFLQHSLALLHLLIQTQTVCAYKKHHVAAPAHRCFFGQSRSRLVSLDEFRGARGWRCAAMQPKFGQVMSWPCLQSRCLLLSHLSWPPFTDSVHLRAWVIQTQNTWIVPYRTFSHHRL